MYSDIIGQMFHAFVKAKSKHEVTFLHVSPNGNESESASPVGIVISGPCARGVRVANPMQTFVLSQG